MDGCLSFPPVFLVEDNELGSLDLIVESVEVRNADHAWILVHFLKRW
jgi:hypothetical protein